MIYTGTGGGGLRLEYNICHAALLPICWTCRTHAVMYPDNRFDWHKINFLPYSYYFSWEQAYFAGLKFRDSATKEFNRNEICSILRNSRKLSPETISTNKVYRLPGVLAWEKLNKKWINGVDLVWWSNRIEQLILWEFDFPTDRTDHTRSNKIEWPFDCWPFVWVRSCLFPERLSRYAWWLSSIGYDWQIMSPKGMTYSRYITILDTGFKRIQLRKNLDRRLYNQQIVCVATF